MLEINYFITKTRRCRMICLYLSALLLCGLTFLFNVATLSEKYTRLLAMSSYAINNSTTTVMNDITQWKNEELSPRMHPNLIHLRGLAFQPSTQLGNTSGELQNDIIWSLLTDFSPAVENHAQLMFRDQFSECKFYAMGPAISFWNGTLIANIRLWQAQFLMHVIGKGGSPVESWQENYVYTLELDKDYRPKSAGRLLGIPATTNARMPYRKDGPMDPRSFVFQGRLFIVYYSYALEASKDATAGRMYLWDYANSIKVKLYIKDIPLQKTSDINWCPVVVSSSLYFVYSLDPLRVVQCDPDSGQCTVVHNQDPHGENNFSKESDHLRGGTPFVEYSFPYFVSFAHSTALTKNGWTIYRTHLVVISVEPWRVAYVSENIAANYTWINSVPVVANAYILKPFWYPTSVILRDPDTADVGCHRNDYSSHVIRINGLQQLMHDAISADKATNAEGQEARPRRVQQYIIECYKRDFSQEQSLQFMGDALKH